MITGELVNKYFLLAEEGSLSPEEWGAEENFDVDSINDAIGKYSQRWPGFADPISSMALLAGIRIGANAAREEAKHNE